MKHSAFRTPLLLDETPVAEVWSGHKVNMALFTAGEYQYAGYYDDVRNMVIAMRRTGSAVWNRRTLNTKIGWDSHNSISLWVDDGGCLHISGNMHAAPMIYFRMEEPHELGSIRPAPMVGRDEEQCTYPRFMRGPGGALLLHYRSGYSGNGREIYNVFDRETRRWRRFLDAPLTDGLGGCNAYFFGPNPVEGPDGFFHLGWMWRDTGDCATNHDISYARSCDLLHWENAAGHPVKLPLTPLTPGLTAVPSAPSGSGLVNLGNVISFDAWKRPVISFHRYDGAGCSRIYNARLEAPGRWRIVPAGNWPEPLRWEFSGEGSIPQMVRFSGVEPQPDGSLLQSFEFAGRCAGIRRLDPDTLEAVETLPPVPELPPELERRRSPMPGCAVFTAPDSGSGDDPDSEYILRWEALPVNRDRCREGAPPPPSGLSVCRLSRR